MPSYVNRRGEQLWYEEAGAGAGCPVVFVHGWCMSSAVWKYQFDGLAASLRLLAPDLRGHGRSRDVSGQLDFATFSADLVDMFDALGLEKAVLVGWSMGAQVALEASAELSNRLAGMILVSATPCFLATDDFPYGLATNEAVGMRLKVQRNTQRALDGFYARLFTEGEMADHQAATEIKKLLKAITPPDTAAVLAAIDALMNADMRNLLANIKVPTLIINGDADQICTPQASDYLKKHIRGAEQFVFHHCGHAPFLTFENQFNAEIVRFIRGVSE